MKRLLSILLMELCTLIVCAQCDIKNTAFKGGEYLTYNLYFNWKFVWVKVGTATMQTDKATYKGKSAYKGSLITRSNSKADKFFVMRDTLLCYTSESLAPLYFRKGAREGKRYTVDEVWYDYGGSGTTLTQHYRNKNGELRKKKVVVQDCVTDMMSMFLRARNMSNAGWKKGHEVKFRMADGDDIDNNKLVYRGKTTIKGDDDKKYNCLELSYMEYEDKKWKEIVRFFVTDDNNHVPVRLDMFLRFGSAKAFVTSMQGVQDK